MELNDIILASILQPLIRSCFVDQSVPEVGTRNSNPERTCARTLLRKPSQASLLFARDRGKLAFLFKSRESGVRV